MSIVAPHVTVANIRKGAKDPYDDEIMEVYQRKGDEYAIYRTEGRVHVQLSDNPEKALKQRRAIAPLLPLRDEIEGLMQSWRDTRNKDPKERGFLGLRDPKRLKAKVACQDRRVSGALAQALEDDTPGARLWLGKIRSDLVDERVAIARFEYLLTASLAALVLMFAAWLFAFLLPPNTPVSVSGRFVNGAAVLLMITLLVASTAVGVTLYGRPKEPRRPTLPFCLAAIALLTLVVWFLLTVFFPSLGMTEIKISRATTIGIIALALLATLGLTLSTAHEAVSDRRMGLILTLVAIPLVTTLIWPQLSMEMVFSTDDGTGISVCRALAAGAAGAFFSIAITLHSRSVLPDLLRTANLMDAVLRVGIGAIGSVVLIILIKGKVVQLPAIQGNGAFLPVIVGFFAGFSERLVPDLLKTADRPADFEAQLAASRAQRDARLDRRSETGGAPIPSPAPTPAAGSAGMSAETADEETALDRDVEVGPEGFRLEDDEVAQDEELPAAAGGVAR